MANNYFQFKQFTIHQDRCAMKVCTDACLFGAYIAEELQRTATGTVKNILDIGTGTGLLSLMLAQKSGSDIDTVEIDSNAFEQAKENIAQTSFNQKIKIFNTDMRHFAAAKKYDYIISNPPFFEADLRSGDEMKNAAKHDTTLTYVELLRAIEKNLSGAGVFAVLLPYHRSNYFEAESVKLNFHLCKKILVKQTPEHDYFRAILIFSGKPAIFSRSEISIKDDEGKYSIAFTSLLKDYYLYL
ncbi:tRNA1(Val) (adenine(37)-N6)-methyltransferase [Ferruginibacter profundus]